MAPAAAKEDGWWWLLFVAFFVVVLCLFLFVVLVFVLNVAQKTIIMADRPHPFLRLHSAPAPRPPPARYTHNRVTTARQGRPTRTRCRARPEGTAIDEDWAQLTSALNVRTGRLAICREMRTRKGSPGTDDFLETIPLV